VCVCVSIYRPAAHMLMTCVLETPKEYRTPGGVSPWASKLYKNPIAREKSSFVCVFVHGRISTVLQPWSGGRLRKILVLPTLAAGPPSLTLYPISSATSARVTKETDRSQNKSGFVVCIPLASRPYASFSKPALPSTTLYKLRSGNVLRPQESSA